MQNLHLIVNFNPIRVDKINDEGNHLMEKRVEFSSGNSLTDSQLISHTILKLSEAVDSANNLDELYSKIYKIISEQISTDSFYIAIYNYNSKAITYPFFKSKLESPPNTTQLKTQVEGLTSYALSQPNPLLLTSKMLKEMISSGVVEGKLITFSEWLSVPLKTLDKKSIGLIALQRSAHELIFSEEHKKYLSQISTHIASAIKYKQSEEYLKSSEQKFRILFEKNPYMLFILDENGKIVDANARVNIDLEYSPEELKGLNVTKVFHEEDKEKVQKTLKECLLNKDGNHKWELRKISKSGNVVWVRESASILNLPNGEVQIFVACENINEYKQILQTLEESEEKYRLLAENVDDMILVHDHEGKIIYINEAGLGLTNLNADEIINSNVSAILSQEYSKKVFEYLSDEKKKDSLFLFEVDLINKDKVKIPVEISLTKMKKRNHHENILFVARDIRERRRAEKSIRNYNEELKRSNYAKDKFFSIIAHDLRSPFNALLSYSDILLDEFDDLSKDELKEYITHINTVSGNIYDLLNNLLDWAKIQTDKFYLSPEIFDLEQTIYKVSTLFKEIAKSKNIDLLLDCEERCYVYADQNMISTVLRNLISNAIKFSHENSKIEIKAKNEIDRVRVTIKDYGIGMLREDITKLFRIDINYTTLGTSQERGTGLGLILSKDMIEKNNGEIFVDSDLGKGSTFTFTLPSKMR